MKQFDFDNKTFDKVSDMYEEVRPGYGQDLYKYINTIKKYDDNSKILEAGCGTGIATKEIADLLKSKITALEPGVNLLAIARKKLCNYSNINFVNTRFEDYNTEELFDGIFSATAFHWIDPGIKYRRAHSLLKNDGLLVLYWNNFRIKDEKLQNDVERVYSRYGMKADERPVTEIQKYKIEQRMDEIKNSGLFTIKDHRLFYNLFEYNSDTYIKLLQTFSDHSKEKIPEIGKLFNEIKQLIIGNNNKVEVSVLVNLEIAEKRNPPYTNETGFINNR